MTILSTLIGLFAALSLSQQTTDKLAFMEIPLGEPLYQFSAQLENKGLTLVDADFGKGYSMFSGSYESHPDCSIVANSDTEGNVKEGAEGLAKLYLGELAEALGMEEEDIHKLIVGNEDLKTLENRICSIK